MCANFNDYLYLVYLKKKNYSRKKNMRIKEKEINRNNSDEEKIP